MISLGSVKVGKTRVRTGGREGLVVGTEEGGDMLIVEVADEGVPRRWSRTSCHNIRTTTKPRGMATTSERTVMAEKLQGEGLSRVQIAERMGITHGAVQALLDRARRAREDARLMAQLRREDAGR